MLDAEFNWIDPDGLYYATKDEVFRAGVKSLVGESYHTTVKDAPVMAPVPAAAPKAGAKSTN